jgi:hypothetical protein
LEISFITVEITALSQYHKSLFFFGHKIANMSKARGIVFIGIRLLPKLGVWMISISKLLTGGYSMKGSWKGDPMSYFGKIGAIISLLMFSMWLQGCGSASQSIQQIKLDSEYKAVFLDNGQAFFGKLDEQGPSYLVLTDIYYVQNQVLQNQQEPAKKEVRNLLIKRGNEWHAPDRMYIERKHIVVIEPVAANSRVSQLIKEAKAQKPAAQQ